MNFTNTERKLLQGLMSTPAWRAVEAYLKLYRERNLQPEDSIKRDTEFNTVWHAAYREGGRDHLEAFFQGMEHEAKQV